MYANEQASALLSEKSPGERKVDEYVERVQAGESLSRIFDGLPPSFKEGIAKQLLADPETPEDMRSRLEELFPGLAEHGMGEPEETASAAEHDKDTLEDVENVDGHTDLEALVEQAMQQYQNPAAQELIKEQYEKRDEPGYRQMLFRSLFGARYKQYREVEYPIDENEQSVWDSALQDTSIAHKEQNGWSYRGIFPDSESKQTTETRASLNVHVTPELLDSLDELIKRGVFKGNYKFGQPNTTASPTERHDSITLYFLEEPDQEILDQIAQVTESYVRGNELLGKKVSEGFYLSEIGSVQEGHIGDLINELESSGAAEFAEAIKEYTTRKGGKGNAMSEAQYYAIKDVAEVFGYDISYDGNDGFVVEKLMNR